MKPSEPHGWLVPPGHIAPLTSAAHKCEIPNGGGFTPRQLGGSVWRCACGRYYECELTENGYPLWSEIGGRRAKRLQRRSLE